MFDLLGWIDVVAVVHATNENQCILNTLAVYLGEDVVWVYDSLCTSSKLDIEYIDNTDTQSFQFHISHILFQIIKVIKESALLVPCCWNWHALPQPFWLTMKRWGGRWPRRSAGKTGTPEPAAAAESSGRDARLRVKCGRIAGKVVRWKGDLEKVQRRFGRRSLFRFYFGDWNGAGGNGWGGDTTKKTHVALTLAILHEIRWGWHPQKQNTGLPGVPFLV